MIVLGYNGFTDGADTFGRLYGATGIDRHSILGHDAAVSLFVDGELVAAVEEERMNREKKTSDFPAGSLRWCLNTADVRLDQVDVIAFPWSFSGDVVDTMIQDISSSGLSVEQKFDRLRRFGELYGGLVCREALHADFKRRTGYDLPADKLVPVPHHFAHLMCGYYLSGEQDAAFLVSDGRAERLSSVMGEVRDGEIRLFEKSSISVNHSLALLFGEITRYLGFMPNNDEYKVMGLAAFAEPPSENPLLRHVAALHEDGRYALALANDPSGSRGYYPLLDRLFGGDERRREETEFRATVAAAAQQMVEVVTEHQLRALEAGSDLDRLIYEGGLALNCVNNSKLLENSRFTDIHVSFGASDPGVAIGAAVYAGRLKGRSRSVPATPYLGPSYSDGQLLGALRDRADRVDWTELDEEAVAEQTAKLLTEKNVVGWFQGRAEYGPRALGNRSILANPGFADIKDIINTRVKHREPFRPFAPVVLESDAARVFDMGKKAASPYMTFVFPVRPEFHDVIPGAMHVDGTSRVQTVTAESNPKLAELLRVFTELTDVPCLVNTSFNVAGEPIVCSPGDALDCFLHTEIDHLVLGRFLVVKK
ncbi:carbamoyltransferase [Streptomyces spectabilis]|uniref:Carbamoyltransferase n=1 Tax=Streptomyces spectabilis TaxID=68270 RepID=A0A516R1Z5_STRST|nr:carbamoyltransferase C-terminal domain-containing protein [Streptomyces spectabilis]QDQ09678.1 carbamoyltransferase [Streptomyces spectabilis]